MSAEVMKRLAADLQSRRNGQLRPSGQQAYGYNVLDDYFSGNQQLGFLHPEVRAQVEDRLESLSINWARVIIGSIEERLDVRGFRIGSETEVDQEVWDMYLANGLDTWSQLGHTDAMKHGRAFGLAWADEDAPDEPRMTIESASQMTVLYKPGTTKILYGAKVYKDPDADSATSSAQIGWLYGPDSVQKYRGSLLGGTGSNAWQLLDELPNPLGAVPIVPFINRPKLTDLAGESELTDVIPLLNAINKLATDMMVSSEYHAMPRRYATGMEIPREARANEKIRNEVRKQWDEALKGRTLIGGKEVKFGHFPEATLDNFINAIKLLVSQIAALAGLPPHYLGLSTDNPASADAIRSAEASLIRKALRKQGSFGSAWPALMRLGLAIKQGVPLEKLDPKYLKLETQWADPNTSTPGAKADAALKLAGGTVPIITIHQAREDLGYTPAQIKRMEEEELAGQELAATTDVRAKLSLADEMIANGDPKPAAYAAVGLIAAASQLTTGTNGAVGQSGQQNV